MLGSLAGNLLSPTRLPGQSGPRLADGQTTTSVVGSPVSIVFGTAAVSGTFMWISPITEHTNTQNVGGKGGPTQTNTTYTYTQSVAVGLCEGPISGIRRIWENGTLVYDVRPQESGESDTDYGNRIDAAALYATTFTLHLGDDTQVADATIEAIEGIGNVPGFRELAYIVYPDRKLLETQALRHPAFKFEIGTGLAGTVPCPPSLLLHFDGSFADSSTFSHTMIPVAGAVIGGPAKFGSGALSIPDISTSTGGCIYTPITSGDSLDILNGSEDWTIRGFFKLTAANGTPLIIFDYGNDRVSFGSSSGIKLEASCSSPGVGTLVVNPTIPGWSFLGTGSESISTGVWYHFAVVHHAGVTSLFLEGVKHGSVTDWNSYTFPATSYLTLGWSPTISGSLNPGEVDEFEVVKGCALYLVDFTPPSAPSDATPTASTAVSLGDIIRPICLRGGLTDVDATDMDTVFVDGYAVSTIAAGRDILTPLRSVGFFDCVESGPRLKFVARGKPIVASLGPDDFGAFDGSATGGTPGPSITTVKALDADLPLQTRVHYFATSRDYENGEQLSPTRLTTTAVNVVDIELAVCLNDTQAAQISDILWSDAWAERWSGTLAVDQAWSELEPGDCIGVPVDGVTRRIRIVSENVASGVLRTLNYVRDDDTAYISHAVAAAPSRLPQKLKLLSATDLELLDLPALLDTDNDAGIYAAARGSTLAGNAWTGCIIFRSADGGATFAQLGSITTAATIGTLNSVVTPSDWHTWDDVTTITVDVPTGVTFESRTDAAVLTGANAAAMGANGRWEIVQFANATQLSTTQWRLSRLLRGRRGTEHNIASIQSGDKFVMISTGSLVRLPLQVAEIGAARIYKAVSIGASYSSGIDQTFAGQGVALRPFSPVDLAAERDTAGDIVFSWIRRGRLGRTLMSGVDIPLSEAAESYAVDIMAPDSPHTIVRTLTVSHPTATYTAAQQSIDFGSDSATHILVAVYQISAAVGRGTPDVQNLTIT